MICDDAAPHLSRGRKGLGGARRFEQPSYYLKWEKFGKKQDESIKRDHHTQPPSALETQ